ncbi:MAG TPA: TIGR02281 family clan AA aspartic protease [Salinarimonas sp.]|jgi:aspartyl protease family protein|nr:TIGR02281 family clan AA aspartic protease [Salinarimonas sp.]
MWLVGVGFVLFGLAALATVHGQRPVAGLQPRDFAIVLALAGAACVATGWMIDDWRGRLRDGIKAMLAWALVLFGLVGLYAYRLELNGVASRIMAELRPGAVEVTSAGEVSVPRRGDGSFVLSAKANGRDLRFILDTGASLVVLTHESAARVGVDTAALAFNVPIATANGRAVAAALTIETLAIGSIEARRVRALVAQPGVLHENLLGMSFLDRLASFEVREGRLYLRGRAPAT